MQYRGISILSSLPSPSHLPLALVSSLFSTMFSCSPSVCCILNCNRFVVQDLYATPEVLYRRFLWYIHLTLVSSGLLKFCTVGFCGIGSLVDFMLIAMQVSDDASHCVRKTTQEKGRTNPSCHRKLSTDPNDQQFLSFFSALSIVKTMGNHHVGYHISLP